MSAETELLDEIFNSHAYWKNKYRLYWCDHCEVWTLICPVCGINGCSGGGCKECSGKDWEEWRGTKHCFESYLSEEEKITSYKIFYLKKYIPLCLSAGFKEINWNWLNDTGQLCTLAYKIFSELSLFDDNRYDDMKEITATELQTLLKNPPANIDAINISNTDVVTIHYTNGTFQVFKSRAMGEISQDVRDFEKSLNAPNARITGKKGVIY